MLETISAKIAHFFSTRPIRKMKPLVQKINLLADSYSQLSDEALKAKTEAFKERIRQGESTSQLLPEAYAVVKEACRRLCGTTISIRGHEMTWDMVPFDVQILGAIALHYRYIAEMATGEGKTLVAIMPLYLNALTGRNVHLVTANDYLAQRDSEWLGHVLRWLGLSVGCIREDMSRADRRVQYACDVTYGTNSEFGFDYLRDMGTSMDKDELVQRGHYFAIIDEIDSILIDEARTPLIISGAARNADDDHGSDCLIISRLYERQKGLVDGIIAKARKMLPLDTKPPRMKDGFARLLFQAQLGMPRHRGLLKLLESPENRKILEEKSDELLSKDRWNSLHEITEELYFAVDERHHEVSLSDKGRAFISPGQPDSFVIPDIEEQIVSIDRDGSLPEDEKMARKREAYTAYSEQSARLHRISQLLKAYCLFERDVDYVVQDGRIVIVDEYTGRPQPDRRFSDGLHQALEAKENVKMKKETRTLATITVQNYFRMYEKLSGMTGTAYTEAQEFKALYNLDVLPIPTYRPCIRTDDKDLYFMTREQKFDAVAEEIAACHRRGRPVLAGTVSVEASEALSRCLQRKHIPHQVLNAKEHEREAEIVAHGGELGAVTIATNMAGRGTDIRLGPGVKELGGLRVIGTEHHDARRIDRQLRGRCARQGDPGSTVFYVSLEDELLRLYARTHLAGILPGLHASPDGEIVHPGLSRIVELSQENIERNHFSARKHTLEYDDVMNMQRNVVYDFRKGILINDDPQVPLFKILEDNLERHMNLLYDRENTAGASGDEALQHWLQQTFPLDFSPFFTVDEKTRRGRQGFRRQLMAFVQQEYLNRMSLLPQEIVPVIERRMMLHAIDLQFQSHLQDMEQLRDGSYLLTYGQKDPLVEYRTRAYELFQAFLARVQEMITAMSFQFQVEVQN